MCLVLLAVMMVALPARVARAERACVPAPGARFTQLSALGAWEVGQIARLRPDGPARLYQGRCGLDCAAGIAQPRPAWDVDMQASAEALILTLSAGGRTAGTLRLAWPQDYEWFGVDTDLSGRAGSSGSSGSGFYAEMRFLGALEGSGDFAAAAGQPAELVLSGFGNACITSRSFSGWMLSVEGPKARFRLFGRLHGG
ncbi:MAG: hypothetical protein Kow0058_13120 [Roseovarius sp.]